VSGQILFDVPAEVYHRRELDVASNSGLTIIDDRSPMHYYHWITHPDDDEDTPALSFGSMFHVATLEPDRFTRTYCVLPPDAPSRPTSRQINAKKPSPETLQQIDWWQAWHDNHAGQQTVGAAEYDEALRMADQLRRHRLEFPGGVIITGAELFDLCRKEVTIRWTDERTGVKCKARLDLLCDEFNFGADLKSTQDASQRAFARSVATYRYHQQHVHYTDGAQAAGMPLANFLFIVGERGKVNAPAVYTIPSEAEEHGRKLRDRGLDTLKRCLDSGRWPSYTSTIEELILPTWAYYE
jgi:exodeoxyribonuclease VIII